MLAMGRYGDHRDIVKMAAPGLAEANHAVARRPLLEQRLFIG